MLTALLVVSGMVTFVGWLSSVGKTLVVGADRQPIAGWRIGGLGSRDIDGGIVCNRWYLIG